MLPLQLTGSHSVPPPISMHLIKTPVGYTCNVNSCVDTRVGTLERLF